MRKEDGEKRNCFRPGSNRRPCACEAHVITTTLRKLNYSISQSRLLASGSGPVAQRITRLTTNQKIAGSNPAWVRSAKAFYVGQKDLQEVGKCQKGFAPPGGLEPPTFRLTAERASQLRHGGTYCRKIILEDTQRIVQPF